MVYAVCNVGKLLRPKGINILKEVIFQYLAVETGNTVHLIAGRQAHISHMHLIIVYNQVSANSVIIIEVVTEVVAPATVNFAYYLPDSGHKFLHQILRPLFESLAHNGVVGVCNAVLDNIPCLVPAHAVLVHENSHKFGDNESSMGVVYLHGVVLGKGFYISPSLYVLTHNVLSGCRYEEILLFQAEKLTLSVVISRIENLCDNLSHSALFKALYIFALREQIHIQRVGAFSIPKAQSVYLISAVTCYKHISGDSNNGGISGVLGVIMAELIPLR
ncbi:hypothetical protein EVA_08056 [gut metagenome]|uniref:Uncharacterized protein n=1 Tax=gut metagenome TaxID=749906 RepID=J9GND7_9ZZZZ